MERGAWSGLATVVQRALPVASDRRFTFAWDVILLTYLWAVIHNQPISWACRPDSWPEALRPPRLPTPSTMSRRLRRPLTEEILRRAIRQLQRGQRQMLLSYIDGKMLSVRPHSQDADATFGGRGGRYRGFKLHLILGENLRIENFAVHPLNVSERQIARELVADTHLQGYLLGDAQYDDNILYESCRARGLQLVTARQYGPAPGLGHRWQSPARLRSIGLLEGPASSFGRWLYGKRRSIEQFFGQLAHVGHGLSDLPPWVRSLARVRLWVTAKLLVFSFMRRHRKRSA